MPAVLQLIENLDTATPQVIIEVADRGNDEKQMLAVEQVIKAFEAGVAGVASVSTHTMAPKEEQTQRQALPGGSRKLSGRGRASGPILDGAARYLYERGARAKSGEITRVLQQHGVKITGKNPSAVVSSYMSHCDWFDNEPGSGYGLRPDMARALFGAGQEPSRKRRTPEWSPPPSSRVDVAQCGGGPETCLPEGANPSTPSRSNPNEKGEQRGPAYHPDNIRLNWSSSGRA